MLHRNIVAARCIVKINLHVPGLQADATLPQAILPMLAGLILIAALAFLPGPALFLAGLTGAVILAIGLAELRRHGGPELPCLPPARER
ncbi:hypothetical protein [Roseicella aerolata]|uniref:Uncharacterized protein n=1 Tax=Roseicella aerolata TaxID=2883479 RepID=A0A9X1IFQ4_9PROT|nr:hypothetical protein [Roseicella aerolata]MCB4823849.1 hypothetical protein [Roseicella aerolata]